MGEVFLADHLEGGRRGALKRLSGLRASNPSFRRRFLQEAKAHQRLRHPRIAEVIDHFVDNDEIYLVTEYLERGSVQDALDKHSGPLPLETVLRWVIDALEGLEFAHQRGVIHRDIKPSNLLLTADERCKITDFGIARVLAKRERLTATGNTLGTPEYMSPEQIRAEEVDPRTDVYSMGIVFYQLLSDRLPFERDTQFEVWKAQLEEPPPPMGTSVPKDLEALVLKALNKDPEDRYPGCGEFAQPVRQYLQDLEEQNGIDRQADGVEVPGPTPLAPPGGESFASIFRASIYAFMLLLCISLFFGVSFYGIRFHESRTSARRVANFQGTQYLAGEQMALSEPSLNEPEPTPSVSGSDRKVPSLLGKNGIEAQKINLMESKLRPGKVLHVFCQDRKSGTVNWQSPAPGTVVPVDSEVDLFICKKRLRYVMPDLVMHDYAKVRRFLEERGFRVGRVTYADYEGMPDGTVLRQRPIRGQPIEYGQVVHLEVSRPEP